MPTVLASGQPTTGEGVTTIEHTAADPAQLATPGNPFDDARAQLHDAVTILGYDTGTYELLANPRRELTVAVPLHRDSGEMELLIGHRVQHNVSRGPAKGGLRYSPDVTLD